MHFHFTNKDYINAYEIGNRAKPDLMLSGKFIVWFVCLANIFQLPKYESFVHTCFRDDITGMNILQIPYISDQQPCHVT